MTQLFHLGDGTRLGCLPAPGLRMYVDVSSRFFVFGKIRREVRRPRKSNYVKRLMTSLANDTSVEL